MVFFNSHNSCFTHYFVKFYNTKLRTVSLTKEATHLMLFRICFNVFFSNIKNNIYRSSFSPSPSMYCSSLSSLLTVGMLKMSLTFLFLKEHALKANLLEWLFPLSCWKRTGEKQDFFLVCVHVILLFPLSCLATPFPCCYSTRGKKVFFFSAC